MSGGGALPGNFLVGKKGGPEDLLSSYDLMGWDPKTVGYDKRFGIPMAANNVSKIFQGMTTTMSAEAQANLRMGSYCHLGQDDSSINTNSAIIEVSKAGLKGTAILNGMGLVNSISGGNSSVPDKQALFKPFVVSNVNDVIGSTGYEYLTGAMPRTALEGLAKANVELQREQIKKYEGEKK
jgi:hypothetical protein